MPKENRKSGSRSGLAVAMAGVALLVAGCVAAGSNQRAMVGGLHDFPLEVTYELHYQQTPDRSQGLATAKVRWVVKSLSEWEFTFLTGPDAGTVYRLEPDGTFTSSDGRTASSTLHRAGVEMVPLPDMALDTKAQITLGVLVPPDSVSVERAGPRLAEARQLAASVSGFSVQNLEAATLTRESSVDAFEYDPDRVPSGDVVYG